VHVSNEATSGLGTFLMFLRPLFATIILVAESQPSSSPKFSRYRSRPPFFTIVRSSEDSKSESTRFSQANVEAMSQSSEVSDTDVVDLSDTDQPIWGNIRPVLIACVPSTGYFAAGAVAGIASRTATAPIDRLKVYLIAQTKNSSDSLMAIRSGAFISVITGAYQTTAAALKDLWAAGGLRSLYAGKAQSLDSFKFTY
jgi:solute carrier family 25 phosphate transporter 23/24/25/41